jgi:hypothetical protein
VVSPEHPRDIDFSAHEASTLRLAESELLAQAEVIKPESTQEAMARDMPKTPFPRQVRPPCKERYEEEIHGGCWIGLKLKPPCGKDAYEWNGACYWPSFPPKPPPNAVNP